MAFTDNAYWTSIARDPSDFSYYIAYTAGNQHRQGGADPRPLNDMELREIFWTAPISKGQISASGPLYFGFGTNWINPHLRVRSTGKAAVQVKGGICWYQQNVSTWQPILAETSSGQVGSLAFAPDDSPGSSYCYTGVAGEQQLTYMNFDSGLFGTPSLVESQTLAAANSIAEVSQIGYLPDGKACIAYTSRTAAGVAVKFALEQTGGSWKIETVSPVSSTPASPSDLVYLDLAVDNAGSPAICWTQRTGSATSLMVALRGS